VLRNIRERGPQFNLHPFTQMLNTKPVPFQKRSKTPGSGLWITRITFLHPRGVRTFNRAPNEDDAAYPILNARPMPREVRPILLRSLSESLSSRDVRARHQEILVLRRHFLNALIFWDTQHGRALHGENPQNKIVKLAGRVFGIEELPQCRFVLTRQHFNFKS
jgi:hypothetical protein